MDLLDTTECRNKEGEWVFLPKQGSCGMTVQVPPGPQWGLPYDKLGRTTGDIDAQGKVKPDAPAVQLYNLSNDVGQATNLSALEPARADAMGKRLESLVRRKKSERPQN
jgi:hypothetical protein